MEDPDPCSPLRPLAGALVHLSRERGVGIERLRAEQLLLDASTAWPGPPAEMAPRWLAAAAGSLNLRAREAVLSLPAAARFARDGALMVGGFDAEGGPVVLVGWDGRHATIERGSADVGGAEPYEKLTLAELAERIHRVEGGEALWLVVDAPEVDSDATGPHVARRPLRRLLRLLRPEWPDVWVVAVFAFFAGLLNLATPIAVESLVNTVAFGQLLTPVLVLSVLLFGFLAFAGAMNALQTFVVEVIQRRLFARVVADLAHRLPRVEPAALDGYHGPELVNRFLDVVTLQKVVANLLLDGLAIVLATFVGMVVLAFYHPWLLGFDALLLTAVVTGLIVLGRGAITTGIDESGFKYRLAAWLEDLLRCPTAFKLGGGAEFAGDRASALTASYLACRRRHFAVLFRQVLFILGLQAVAGTALLGVGGWLVIRQQLSLAQLVAAELIVATILGSLAKLGKHLDGFYDLMAAVDKLGKLIDLPVERQDGAMSFALTGPASLTFTEVVPAGVDEALQGGFSLSVRPAERVALLGPTGSGKSTLVDVAFGLRAPATGHVEVAGADPRDLRPDVLRRSVALARGVELFEGTIAENILIHRTGVGMHEARDALASLGMLDDVTRLPESLDTPLNASGWPLSSTQQAMLMLARAVVVSPSLLLIDGLLDSLPDADRERVVDALVDPARTWTLLVATGREDIARAVGRIVTLDPPKHAVADSQRRQAVGGPA